MTSALKVQRSKSEHIDGAQFRFGLEEVQFTAKRFAELFCNGRTKRVHEWLGDEVPVPMWVPALLAAMQVPEARTRAIATAEHLRAAYVATELSEEQLKAAADKVRSHAATAVDLALVDVDATKQEKAERRGALTDEPAVIAKARDKGQVRKPR